MKRILVAVDGSAPSLHALDVAAALAKPLGASLLLVAVVRTPDHLEPELEAYARIEHLSEPLTALLSTSAEALLETVRARALAHGARPVDHQVRIGQPAEQILAAAASHGADLIVCGNRGHGHLAGLLLGSVAQAMLTAAERPVLVVPRAA